MNHELRLRWWRSLTEPQRQVMLAARHIPLPEDVIRSLAAYGLLEAGDFSYWMPEEVVTFLDALESSYGDDAPA